MVSMSSRSGLFRSCVVGGVLISLVACQTTKQEIGTLAGAGLGVLAGSLFGDGKGKIVAMVVGAAAGAWLGNQLGKYLDEQEQKKLVEQTQTTATTGKAETWKNPDTGTSIKTTVVAERTKTENVQVPVKKAKITMNEMPRLQLIGQRYEVLKNSNVRGGPSTNYVIVDSLQSGNIIDIMGQVDGEPWFVIGENGVASGFIYSSLVAPTDDYSEFVLADPSTSSDAGVEFLATSASTNCRDIKQTIVLKNGDEQTETITACEGPNGWETQDV